MLKPITALFFGIALASSAQAQTTVTNVHYAMLSYRCECSKAAYQAMPEYSRTFLAICGSLPPSVLADEIAAKKGMQKWDGMLMDYMAYDIALVESCSDEEMKAWLKKQFPKNKEAAIIEQALANPPDDVTVLSWRMDTDGCDFIVGRDKLLKHQESHPEDFELDFLNED